MKKEFFEMQQDAVKRVRDMQKRARETVNPQNVSEAKPKPKKTISKMLNLKNFDGNQEDLLILSLIILLSDEGADMMLVLALLYLIL